MTATASPVATPEESIGTRVRNLALAAAFGLVLLVPRLLRLRHNPQSWLAFRILLAVAGASLVIVPLSIASSWIAAIVGLLMFLAAILVPPARADRSVDEKTKELGALVVVNGGTIETADKLSIAVQLYVGADRVHVLDSDLRERLTIPVADISSAIAAEARDRWILHIRWAEHTTDFEYGGVFAQHLARVAESTIRSAMHPSLPVLRQTRAAGA